MNPLLFSPIQSAAYGNDFEQCSRAADGIDAVFSSMTHRNEVGVADEGKKLILVSLLNTRGLKDAFPELATEDGLVIPHPKNNLANHKELLGRIFKTAARLPPDAGSVPLPRTETRAVIKARLGQHLYKTRQLADWGDACAVTGITTPALLRASHAKPWAVANDRERVDPANGLPLAIHLDALFDVGLISFASDGSMLLSPLLDATVVALYGLSSAVHLRRIPSPVQDAYLGYHRSHVFKAG